MRTTLHPYVDLVGMLEAIPKQTATVSPRVGGWIESVEIVEGESVTAGNTLVRLDSRTAAVDLARAKAVVKEKEAVLEQLKSGYLPQEIEMARKDADKFKQTVSGLRLQFQALEPLLKRNEVSPVQYETAKANLEAAEAAHASAVARLQLLEAGTRREQIDKAEAVLDTAKTGRDAADLAVQFCNITAPIDGTVTQLLARRGVFVERATPLATIVDLSTLFVNIRVPTVYMSQIRPGQHVELHLTSLPGKLIKGTVARISGQANSATGDVDAFAQVANENNLLRPGLAGRVRIWLPDVPDAVAVPVAAVADHSGTSVVTVVRDNKAYEVEVKLGRQAADLVQILDGVSPGDLLVTSGGYGLPDGCPVQVAPEPSGSPSR